jgi:hypothetical protein
MSVVEVMGGARRHPYRRIVAAGLSATLLVLMTACSSSGGGTGGLAGAGTSSAPVATTPATTPGTPSTTPPTNAPASHSYPTNYFAAILAAWKAHDTAYLTLLTNASTAAQIFGYGNINQTWTGTGSQGAAGSSYESFYNNAGDWLTLRSTNQDTTSKTWHAGSVNAWDKMTFPADANAYVKRFIDAWINGNVARMSLLSNSTMAAQFTGMSAKPDSSYTTSSHGAASGHSYYEVKDPSISLDITLQLANQFVGSEHAIESCYSGC